MLRVATLYATSAGASAAYYTQYLGPKDSGEEPGQWRGRQAEGLGLQGTVETDQLEAILSGNDPSTGARLGSALVDRFKDDGTIVQAVAGYDATFSAPKSLSVWWALTGDRGLLEAHDTAVAAVLGHLEAHGATTRIRVRGPRAFVDTQGLTMATFRQSTSREDDPQIHTHCVISTKVQTDDGRWFALDARYLKQKQRSLGGLYQSVLRAEVSHRYGVTWGPIVHGQAEILGFPAALLEEFSKRAAQVETLRDQRIAEFRETERRDPTERERAAISRQASEDSRRMKSGATVADLTAQWRQDAAELGYTADGVLIEMAKVAAHPAPQPQPTLGDVLDLVTAQFSTWRPIDLLQALCDVTPPSGDLSGPDWAEALDAAIAQIVDDHIDLDPASDANTRRSDGRSIWLDPMKSNLTCERVLAQEERILTFAIEAQDPPPAPSPNVDVEGLDVLQADAARAVAGHDTLVLVVGPAGTGKTTALARAIDDLHRARRPTFGVAPSAKAAHVLEQEAGVRADTVAKLLHEWSSTAGPSLTYRLPAGTTLIVDEAGMLGTESLDRIVGLAVSQQWRLVLVGDPRQLQAVGRGGMFDELCRTGRTHELATIHRFRHGWEQDASLDLRYGKPAALDAYLDHDRVVPGTAADHLDAIADAWVAHTAEGRTIAVTAETNAHVDALNGAIQAHRREVGHVDTAKVVRVAGSETAGVGDLLVTRRNDRALLASDGQHVRNRELWAVEAIGRDSSLTVSRIQGHATVELPADYAKNHVRLGYAATAHGHQGETTDVSLTLVSGSTTHRGLYVGATRGRAENHLHVVTENHTLDGAKDVLERALASDRADRPAVARRQELASDAHPHRSERERNRAAAQAAFSRAAATAKRFEDAVSVAEHRLGAVRRELRDLEVQAGKAGPLSRRRLAEPIRIANDVVHRVRADLDQARRDAQPTIDTREQARAKLEEADRLADQERLQQELAKRGRSPVQRQEPGRSLGR